MRRAIPLAVLAGLAVAILVWMALGGRPSVSGGQELTSRDARSSRDERPGVRGQPPAAGVQRPAPARPQGTLVHATWGSGPGQLGRSRPNEGNPEAPSSFTLDQEGRLLVLDRTNGRIARYDKDGRPLDPIALTQRSPQEIITAPDGSTVVMDRLADKSAAIFDKEGKLKGELPITGKGLEQGGSATGLFADEKGIYVESEHGELIRIGDTTGKVDEQRPPLDGRPTRDGRSLLSAGGIDPASGRFWVRAVDRASGQTRFQQQVTLSVPYLSIIFLDSDRAGGIYAGAHVARELEPGKMSDEAVHVVCLGTRGEVRGVAVLPANTMPEETFRDLAVHDDGTIVYMVRSEAGVAVRSYRCN